MKMRLANSLCFPVAATRPEINKKTEGQKNRQNQTVFCQFCPFDISQENRDAPSCVIRPQMDGRGHCDTEIFCPAG